MTDKERELALYCLKASSDYHSEVCEECINYPNCDHTIQDDVTETIIKALEQESIAQERYEDLCEYFGDAKGILNSRDDFKAWLDRVKWHIHKAEELSAENDDLRDQLAMRDRFQEPKYCDRNICVSNEYNGIGCRECEVTKSQEPNTEQFAKWVATEIFDDNWEYNKDAFAELACRKLAKLGIVIRMGDEWELVEPQESEEV